METIVFFLSPSGFLRELMARVVRGAIGRVVCVIADYSAVSIAQARRVRAVVIADRPGRMMEQDLRAALSAGEIADLIVINASGDSVPPFAGAPAKPRRAILANGEHSAREAIAFDMHALGHGYERIADWLKVDVETAKTFVRRAEAKNRRHPEVAMVLRQIAGAG